MGTTGTTVDSSKEWILFFNCVQIRNDFHLDRRAAAFEQVQNVLFHLRR